MSRLEQLLTEDEILALAAKARLEASGKRNVGNLGTKPVVAGSMVYWPAAKPLDAKTFFDPKTQSDLTEKFTGTRTWPNGFQGENVTITHIRIDPELMVDYETTISGAIAGAAYHYLQTGTMIKGEVGDNTVFEINIKNFLPQYSVGNGAGVYTLITKDNFDIGFELPDPVFVPAGKNLKVYLVPPPGLKTGADAAGTTGHYPNISASNIYTMFLQAFGWSEAANV